MKSLEEFIIEQYDIECSNIMFGDKVITEGFFQKIKDWFVKIFTSKKKYGTYGKTNMSYNDAKDEIALNFSENAVGKLMGPIDKTSLLSIIKNSLPNKEKNIGFWLFDEAIKKDESYLKINSKPFYIKYFAWPYSQGDLQDICGLISISSRYSYNENEKKDCDGCLHIFDIQTDSKYRGNNLLKKYFNDIEEYAKQEKFKGLTLRCYKDSLTSLYSKYGFKQLDGQNLMVKKFNK